MDTELKAPGSHLQVLLKDGPQLASAGHRLGLIFLGQQLQVQEAGDEVVSLPSSEWKADIEVLIPEVYHGVPGKDLFFLTASGVTPHL